MQQAATQEAIRCAQEPGIGRTRGAGRRLFARLPGAAQG